MAIRNILVAYNGSASSDAALAVAVHMHRKYDAHITGLLAGVSRIDHLDLPWMPDMLRASIVNLDRDHVETVHAAFDAATVGKIAEDKRHWISRRGASDVTVAEYAHMYDLTIVGRGDTLAEEKRLELHPDRIALKSGRPVLVVPQSWSEARFHEHALLAWDGNRSATRALADAMQMLESKQKVTVLSVAGRGLGRELDGINVETVLARHNIQTERVFIERTSKGIADVLLEECAARKAGLLVMGAYEHSKFREDILGGVTNSVIAHSTIPVLLSH